MWLRNAAVLLEKGAERAVYRAEHKKISVWDRRSAADTETPSHG